MSLDPDALAVVNLIKATGRPPLHTMTVEEGRVAYSRAGPVLGPEPQEVAEVRDLKASGPGGDIQLRLTAAPARRPARRCPAWCSSTGAAG